MSRRMGGDSSNTSCDRQELIKFGKLFFLKKISFEFRFYGFKSRER